MKFYKHTLLIISLLFPFLLNAESKVEGASPETRLEQATKHIEGNPDQIAVFTKGLICSSCGIGIRRHIKKLDFVDQKQLEKGIELDIKNQLALVAIKKGEAYDANLVRDAIFNAGYDPIHYYKLDGKSVVRAEFTTK